MSDPYLLNERTANRLRGVLAKQGQPPSGFSPVPNDQMTWIRVDASTGTVGTTPIYRGKIVYRAGPGSVWAVLGTANVTVYGCNNGSLTVGKVYLCGPGGLYQNAPCFAAAPVALVSCDETGTINISM